MKELMVHEGEKPIYPIHITDDFDSLKEALSVIEEIGTRKICIVTDDHVAPLYLEAVTAVLEQVCPQVTSYIFKAGEENKQLSTVQQVYEHLILNHFERRDLLAALGGGVVGDLTGYTAATYLRGIDFIQIPTTLLSMVDSGIGGKTGVDFKAYKNMVGAFHQPRLVYTNVSTLKTLNERQYLSGMGEIIKHGLIKSAEYYSFIKDHQPQIMDRDPDTLIELIYGSDLIKEKVVAEDPKEKGERAKLNFGHTLGHAIEKLMDFSMYHGDCVAVGSVAAARISLLKGLIDESDYEDIVHTLKAFDLPVTISGLSVSDIIKASKNDKKMSCGKIRFILLTEIGSAIIDHHVSDEDLENGLKAVCE